jgi:hypothetical protein
VPGVDGGTGLGEGVLSDDESSLVQQMATRLQSDPAGDPLTGAMLGMGLANGSGEVDPLAARKNAELQLASGTKEPPLGVTPPSPGPAPKSVAALASTMKSASGKSSKKPRS